ncbi:hypothetical protein [Ruegeria sp. AU67]|uniref:hypothetical protein n=1 Tax=Ruegeria sp. AU67 TaxID=2108530 RepID=UPI000D68922E|nr:hypothetical protein [Ruegeria sp. AU67]
MKDIKPRFEAFIEKAQKAKFHDVAEDFLEAVEKMASELSQKVKASSSSDVKSNSADKPKKQRRPSYNLEDDTPVYRMSPEIKSKHKLTDSQLKKIKEEAALWKSQDGPYKGKRN